MNHVNTIKQDDKISRMCERAVGRRISINMGSSGRGKRVLKNWVVVSAEFDGWRERQRSAVARFKLTLENPPCFQTRATETVVVESFNSLHD